MPERTLCRICLQPILIQIFRGTGYCCGRCEKTGEENSSAQKGKK